MKLTVGPLPPAVYWRRRVVLLGGLLLVVLLTSSLCSTSSSGKPQTNRPRAASDQTSAEPPEPTPTTTLQTPSAGDPTGSAGPAPAPPPTTAPATPAPTGPCTDAEVAVAAAPVSTTVKQGVPLKIFLKVKNVSTRTCSRDVGADVQELVILQGKTKVWSSDDCGALHGTDVKSFGPGLEVSYYVIWDAKATTAGCDKDKKPWPAPGAYQVVARLGTKYSEPVTLTISA